MPGHTKGPWTVQSKHGNAEFWINADLFWEDYESEASVGVPIRPVDTRASGNVDATASGRSDLSLTEPSRDPAPETGQNYD